VEIFTACKTEDQSAPSIKFLVETHDTLIVLTNQVVSDKIDISGDPIKWTIQASDMDRIQSVSFYYKNLRLEFPDGLEGVDTLHQFFTVGGQTVGHVTFEFEEYKPEQSVVGMAYHDVDSRAILKNGSFYHIKAVDLDVPVNHVSPSLSLTIE
jgi:hypothetical protein